MTRAGIAGRAAVTRRTVTVIVIVPLVPALNRLAGHRSAAGLGGGGGWFVGFFHALRHRSCLRFRLAAGIGCLPLCPRGARPCEPASVVGHEG